MSQTTFINIEVRGSPKRDISFLSAMGWGPGTLPELFACRRVRLLVDSSNFVVLRRCSYIFGTCFYIGVRGSPEQDISSLHAFGPGGRQVLRVVRVARALFDVFEEK